jgi:hypothetical protein
LEARCVLSAFAASKRRRVVGFSVRLPHEAASTLDDATAVASPTRSSDP